MKWVLCSAAVTLTACLSGSVLADDSNKQDSRSCGEDYPLDFPCIAGGMTFQGLDGIQNVKSNSVLIYTTSPKKIAERIEAEATSNGWVLVKREVGMEPGKGPSPRYRYSYEKAGVTVHTSAYESTGRTVLMVVTLIEQQ